MEDCAPKAKRKRRERGVSERTLRRRKAEKETAPPPRYPIDSDSADESSHIDNALDSIYRLFQESGSSNGRQIVQPQRRTQPAISSDQAEQTRDSEATLVSQDSTNDCVCAGATLDSDSVFDIDCVSVDDIAESDKRLGGDWVDAVFCGALPFYCDTCIRCSCIVCEVCSHSETGDCVHCDRCRSFQSEDEDGGFFDDGEEVISPEAARNRKITDEFKDIADKNRLTHTAVNDLVLFFRKWNLGDFPKSSKTFLNTPQVTPTRPVPPGEYWHAGITNPLIDHVKKTQCDEVKVAVSVDGVPLSNSSNSSFWPILCCFNDSPDIILAGAYHGYSKPLDSNVYLDDFNEEMTRLCSEELVVDGKSIKVTFHSLHCDAPAKAFVLKFKNCNGYFSCPKCTQEGEMDGRRMCFPEVDAPLRTDESFNTHQQPEHHVGTADIQFIPTFGPVSRVPYDYMHLVLLGDMRKVLYMWLQGPLNVRLKGAMQILLSDLLVSLMSWKPREFVRKLRHLQFIKRFKATEFRQILFYAGPVVFQPVLSKDLYEHFLVLHVAMTLLAHPRFVYTHVDYAEQLLKFWVVSFKSLYGASYMSHNIHGLTHLAGDVHGYGPVDKFSAFKFENFLQFLVKLIRKGDKPLQQLARRYSEMSSFLHKGKDVPHEDTFFTRHVDGPLLTGCANPQFSKFYLLGNVHLDSSSEANNCCVMENGSVVVVKNFAFSNTSKEMVVIGREFSVVTDLYSYPMSSSVLGIHFVSDLSPLRSWPTKCVCKKLYRMPFKTGFAVVPLLHAEKGI